MKFKNSICINFKIKMNFKDRYLNQNYKNKLNKLIK